MNVLNIYDLLVRLILLDCANKKKNPIYFSRNKYDLLFAEHTIEGFVT